MIGVPAQDVRGCLLRHHFRGAEMASATDMVVVRVGVDDVGDRRRADPPDRREVLRSPGGVEGHDALPGVSDHGLVIAICDQEQAITDLFHRQPAGQVACRTSGTVRDTSHRGTSYLRVSVQWPPPRQPDYCAAASLFPALRRPGSLQMSKHHAAECATYSGEPHGSSQAFGVRRLPCGRRTSFGIRPARDEDRLALAVLFAAVAEERSGIAAEPPVDVDARAAAQSLDGALAAAAGDDIIGWLHLEQTPFGFGEIGMLVASEWRGRGVGSALLEAAIERARERGMHKLSLSVFAHNTVGALGRAFTHRSISGLTAHHPDELRHVAGSGPAARSAGSRLLPVIS